MKRLSKLLLFSLVLLIFCLANVSATEIQSNDTTADTISIFEQNIQNTDSIETIDTTAKTKDLIKNEDEIIKKEASNTITVTSNNYNQYFQTENYVVSTTDKIKSGNVINLQGTFQDLEFNVDKENLVLTSIGKKAQLINCTIHIDGPNNQNSTVTNLTINNSKKDCEGIIINDATNIHVTNNRVYCSGTNGFVITTYNMKNSSIENNYFESTHTQTNLRIYSSDNNYITNNTVIGYANCIYLCAYDEGESNYNVIRKNTVIGKLESPVCYTIQLMGNGNIAEENVVCGGYRGISSEYSNIIRNNDVDAVFTGIYTGGNSTIENNNIHVSKNASGITINGKNSIVRNNIITTNTTGIVINNNNIMVANNTITATEYGIYSKAYPKKYTGITIDNNSIQGELYNDGTMIVNNNTISNTPAKDGGVIYNLGTINLTDNKLINNNATIAPVYNNGSISSTNNYFVNNLPKNFEINNKINLADHGNYIPINAEALIYENGKLIKTTVMKNSVINYALPDSIYPYEIVLTNNTQSFRNNRFLLREGLKPEDILITINPIKQVSYNDNITVQGIVTDKENNVLKNLDLKIVINNQYTTAKTDTSGLYTYTTKATTIGTNNVTVICNETILSSAKNKTTFNVIAKKTKITINKISDTQYTDIAAITGKFTDVNNVALKNSAVTITINGIKYTNKTDNNGIYTYNYKTTTPGTNNITVSYAGNTKYKATNTTTTFKVTPKTTKITINKITNTQYTDTTTITGTFKTSNGVALKNSAVAITINGIKYTNKTDNNGIFRYEYKTGIVGTNNVTVSYGGNTRYSATNTTTTFTVNKKDTKITINKINTTTKGSTITVTGKFTNSDGVALTNSNVKVNINGVTTSVKTDNKGIYSISYKTTVIGTNNITVSYPGNTKYNSYSTATTFKVQ